MADLKLHRLHAAPQATRVQFDTMGITWRGEGGSVADKTAMARRLAVAWNVCEGFPTPALERGLLLELVNAVAAGNLEAAQAAVAEMDRSLDMTGGRLNDCVQCGAPPAPVVIEPDDGATDEPDNDQLEMTL